MPHQPVKAFLIDLFAVIIILGFFLACASSKSVSSSSIGTWNYTVKDTPYGIVNGEMIIMQEGEIYAGQLQSDKGTAALEDISINGKNLTSNLTVDGNKVSLEGSFDKDTFNGKVIAGHNSYDITANRVR